MCRSDACSLPVKESSQTGKHPPSPNLGDRPSAVEHPAERETIWNDGYSAGWKAAKEGPPGYRERLRAVNTFTAVDLAKEMHDAILEVSSGQGIDDATLIASLIIALGNFLPGSLDPTQRDEWVQQFIAVLPAFVAMAARMNLTR